MGRRTYAPVLEVPWQARGAKWKPLVAAEAMSGFRSLKLESKDLGDLGAVWLAENGKLATLEHLDLTYNNIGLRGLKALMECKQLEKLQSLSLRHNNFGTPGIAAIGKSRAWPRLVSLELSINELDDAAAMALSKWPGMERLEDLHLVSSKKLTGKGLRALLEPARRLRVLNLDSNYEGGDTVAEAIAEASHIDGLETLLLGGNSIKDAGMTALFNAEHLGSLVRLDLRLNSTWSAGGANGAMPAFAKCSWRKLKYLDLSVNGIDAGGLELLVGAPAAASLEHLDVGHNYFRDAGIEVLLNASRMKKLTYLNLDQSGLEKSWDEKIRAKHPKLEKLENDQSERFER